MSLMRQHLIDPEICIRCGSCEEACPIDAITHNEDNYVVAADICEFCQQCVAVCPTGAIDNWFTVQAPYSLEEQFEWDELPEEQAYEVDEAAAEAADEANREAAEILSEAQAAGQGQLVPPFSAAHPYINVYTRERPATARIVGNYRLTDRDSETDTRHIVLDFGTQAFPVLEGQSIGILPPGTDARGRSHHVRLFSIASPRDGERPNHNNVALTVKREYWEEGGTPHYGVASSYLCDLERGAEVQVTGPFNNTFLMPNHPEAKLVMICTGTGSAPFRAMTERRRRYYPEEGPGRMLLFFGARTPQELPYHGPLLKLPKTLIDIELVYSRMPGQPKEYVQDRMRKRADDLAELLADDDSFFYVCGIKGMEQGVDDVFAEICQRNGTDWKQLRSRLQGAGRYHVETY